jgi:hypothetical protein
MLPTRGKENEEGEERERGGRENKLNAKNFNADYF